MCCAISTCGAHVVGSMLYDWWTGDVVVHDVWLSASTVASCAILATKCQSSLLWGAKPANADLQMVNLLGTGEDDYLIYDLLRVGWWVLKDERDFVLPGYMFSGMLEYPRPTAWSRVLDSAVTEFARGPGFVVRTAGKLGEQATRAGAILKQHADAYIARLDEAADAGAAPGLGAEDGVPGGGDGAVVLDGELPLPDVGEPLLPDLHGPGDGADEGHGGGEVGGLPGPPEVDGEVAGDGPPPRDGDGRQDEDDTDADFILRRVAHVPEGDVEDDAAAAPPGLEQQGVVLDGGPRPLGLPQVFGGYLREDAEPDRLVVVVGDGLHDPGVDPPAVDRYAGKPEVLEGPSYGPDEHGRGYSGPLVDGKAIRVAARAVARVKAAEAAVELDRQQAACGSGDVLHSSVALAASAAKTSGQLPDEAEQVGSRTARARFASMAKDPAYLFGNDPRNLESAEALRNVGVGTEKHTHNVRSARDYVVDALEELLFSEENCLHSLHQFENWAAALPKRMTEPQKERCIQEYLTQSAAKGVLGFNKFVKAFVKAEVSSKRKPRPIANHGELRVAALARIAWVFEDIMFHHLERMSIKHLSKRQALGRLYAGMNRVQKGGQFVENDLSAFEFGVCRAQKEIEQRILMRIAKFIGVHEEGTTFERVVNDRSKACVWSMSYVTAEGEKKTFKLELPRPMRESGDRLTSSGNFLQNLVAWLTFLCYADRDSIRKTVEDMIRVKGAFIFYVSAARPFQRSKDGTQKKYMAVLAFEGDDTSGKLEEATEPLFHDRCKQFFLANGWSPKLKFLSVTGSDFLRFVGWDVLVKDNFAVFQGKTAVCCPEIKRMLTTKQWTTTDVNAEQLRMCNRIYAATMAEGFSCIEPMWQFCRGLHDTNAGADVRLCFDQYREYYLTVFGELPGPHTAVKRLTDAQFPDLERSDSSGPWRQLAELSAGACTDREWSTMCAPLDTSQHGKDLACSFPPTWSGKDTVVIPRSVPHPPLPTGTRQ